MSTGRVSSTNIDNWDLISTFTVSSAAQTQAIATGISGYKTLLLAANNLSSNSAVNWGIYFNGDVGNNTYGSFVSAGNTIGDADAYIRLTYYITSAPSNGCVIIENASNATITKTTSSFGGGNWGIGKGFWNNTAAITSITAYVTSGTITAGTFKLYGLKF